MQSFERGAFLFRLQRRAFRGKIFTLVPKSRIESFLKSTGLFLTEPDERGRIYPVTETASTVVDCLRFALLREGVKSRFAAVERIEKQEGNLPSFALTATAGSSTRSF